VKLLADLFDPMNRERFLKVLAERFYPVLRDQGFKGSGTTLRRVREPVIHVVNIQGSSSADGFYVNLGAHLDFLPTEGGGSVGPGQLHEADCAFRDRIDPPPKLRRWPYARTSVGKLLSEWERQGPAFFEKYSVFPDDFRVIVEAAVATPPAPYDGLKYARIASHLGLRDQAAALARVALANVAPAATGLRAQLRRFLDELGPE
jgi:hypothetical protein